MKAEEEKVLFKEKTEFDKKSIEQANKEIKILKGSQIKFKNQEKEIKDLERRINTLTNINSVLKTKNFNLNLKLNSIHKEKREVKSKEGNGTIKYVNRIMIVLKETNKPMNITELKNSCCMDCGDIYPCLTFMERYNLIKSEKDSSKSIRYSIK